ncbi:hypothetical protein JW710_04265 [Candidatus Dojkabacteria bacterium]|nr:hypothetical protein [Candidatus Dojkabacteria bacterium]
MIVYIVTIITSVSCIFFILLILTRRENKRLSKTQRSLSFFIFFILLWSIANQFSLTSANTVQTLFWIRAVLVITVPLLTFLLYFSNYYPENDDQIDTKIIHVLAAIQSLTFPLYFTGFVVKSVAMENGNIIPSFGPGMIMYVINLLILLIVSSVILIKKWRTATGLSKTRMRYLVTGIVLTIVPTLVTNLIFVVFLKQSLFVFLGPAFILFLILFSTISVIRHQLFGINVLIGNILSIVLTAILPFVGFYLVAIFELNIDPIIRPEILLLNFGVAFIYKWIDESASKVIQGFIRRKIISSEYDSEAILREYTALSGKILHLRGLADLMSDIIQRTLRTKGSFFIFFDSEDENSPILQYGSGELSGFTLSTHETSLIKKGFADKQEIIEAESLEKKVRENSSRITEELLKFMNKNGIIIAIPVRGREETTNKETILGVILLKDRSQTEVYAREDIEFLSNFENQTSISASRCIFFSKFQDLNRNLQQKVDHATEELQRRNEELQDLYDNLEELFKKEKDLMDIAGHELRTPASILKTNLYLLKNRLEKLHPENVKDEKVNKYFERLVESTERQIRLVNTFLESARIENKKFELNMETGDFVELISKAVEDISHTSEEKGLKLIYTPPNKRILVDMDTTRMREVIDNLLSNAVKYTTEGYIEVKINEDKETVGCSIKDSGVGIRKEDQAVLFKKFSRVKSHIGDRNDSLVRPGGTGLGLYVSKNVIDSHKGKIWVESEGEGKGSTFFFEIPKKQKNTGISRYRKENLTGNNTEILGG